MSDERHPRFFALHQAVRAGIELVPDPAPPRRYFGVSEATGRLGCDVLAAAWFAEFSENDREDDEHSSLTQYLSRPLLDAYPVLVRDLGMGCPVGPDDKCPKPKGGTILERKIIHIQDWHGFTREQVADWLQERHF